MLFSDFRSICFDDKIVVHVRGFEGSTIVRNDPKGTGFDHLIVEYFRHSLTNNCPEVLLRQGR